MKASFRPMAAGLLIVPALAAADEDAVTKDGFPGNDGKVVEVQVVSMSPSDMRLRVLYPPAVAGQAATKTSIRGLTSTPSSLAPPRPKHRSLFSAGFSSYRNDVPVGLLVSDGKLQSPVDVSPPRIQTRSSCEAASASRYRFAGILCVPSNSTSWRILPTGEYQPGQCKEAVQSGPMLVEPGGKPGVCAQSDQVAEKPYPRLAACLDAAGSLHMVMTKPTTLYPLSQWLIQGRLKCVTALNFSGADQAGWARLATWAKPFPKYQGGVDAPLASALLFEQK